MFSLQGYQAVRTAVALARRSDRGLIAVSGSDRLTWLQGLLTNDVLAVPLGGACDAAYLTPQGRMIAELRVINLPDRVLLDVPAGLAASLTKRLDGLVFSEDAQIVDRSDVEQLIELHGPRTSEATWRAAVDPSSATVTFADHPYGVPSVGVVAPAAAVDPLVARLLANGALEISLDTLDVVRVEAGRPAFLVDMDEHTIPLEAGLEDRAISFTKGCYVGQEVIVRVMQRGQGRVARKLVGLTIEAEHVPLAGDVLRADGRDVGRITSAVWSPLRAGVVALGYVHRDFTEPRTPVDVVTSAGSVRGTVASVPFVPSASLPR
jgi:folate-binding protein YgfZ